MNGLILFIYCKCHLLSDPQPMPQGDSTISHHLQLLRVVMRSLTHFFHVWSLIALKSPYPPSCAVILDKLTGKPGTSPFGTKERGCTYRQSLICLHPFTPLKTQVNLLPWLTQAILGLLRRPDMYFPETSMI